MRRHARARRAAWFVALSFAFTVLAVVPANAATPTMTASLSPGSASAGAQTPFTLSVSSDQGSLQTLTLDAPSNFNVDLSSVVLSSGTLSGSSTATKIVVGGLKISGSEVLTVAFDAYPGCTHPATGTWTLNGTQKGGTAYAQQTFATAVTSPSSCKLVFQPIVDQLTNVSFPGGVKVDVVRANGTIDPTYGDQVSLSIATDPGSPDATLTSNSPQTPSEGTATFSASLNKSGYGYVLEACSPLINGTCPPASGGAHFLSNAFAVYDSKKDCVAGNSCFTSASIAQQVSTQVSANGQANTSVKAGVFRVPDATPGGNLSNLDCPGYNEITEVIASFDFNGSGIKTVTNTVSAEQMKEIANQGVSFLQVCFGSSLPFTDRFGNPATPNPTLGLFVGLMKDCPPNKKNLASFAPCVVSRQGGGMGTGTITYVAKEGDPGGARH